MRRWRVVRVGPGVAEKEVGKWRGQVEGAPSSQSTRRTDRETVNVVMESESL